MSTLTSSRIAATAMLAIAVAAPAAAKSDTAEVRCAGVNTCKGLGWLHVPTAQECVAQGGKVLAD